MICAAFKLILKKQIRYEMQKQIELWRDNRQKYDFQPLTLERKLNQSQRAR